jgi:hypothetical protein
LASSVTPLASRSSAPAEVIAEFFAGITPLMTKLAPGSVWNAPRGRDPHVFMAKMTIPKNNSATTAQMMMNLSKTR